MSHHLVNGTSDSTGKEPRLKILMLREGVHKGYVTLYLRFYEMSRKDKSVQAERPAISFPMEVGPGLPKAWAGQLFCLGSC